MDTGISAAGALIFASLGIEPQVLVWALIGASIGLVVTEQKGWVKAVLMFVAVSLACSMLGTFIADEWWKGSHIARNSFALCLAMGFHPLFSAVVTNIPAAISGALKKAGLKE